MAGASLSTPSETLVFRNLLSSLGNKWTASKTAINHSAALIQFSANARVELELREIAGIFDNARTRDLLSPLTASHCGAIFLNVDLISQTPFLGTPFFAHPSRPPFFCQTRILRSRVGVYLVGTSGEHSKHLSRKTSKKDKSARGIIQMIPLIQ